ncbi:unnamed protein product [Brachionus calyciflorus]|uniref:GIY-YIG domain-containing protein n=1 Tax=Brachionus calyciflorus TaxID=104777 RepID=A0A814GQG3_9BILA|nr:unnamed protein product [Brachionus calyciflorus]
MKRKIIYGVFLQFYVIASSIKHLLIVCTQESHFQFNGEYFDQTDGVAMGSPLGPLFANIFMSEFTLILSSLFNMNNQFPQDIIEEEFKRFEIKKPKQLENIEGSIEVKRYIVLPYSNNKCEYFARRLKKLVVSNFTLVNFNVAYQTPKTISIHFPFKDNIKKNEDKSLVVYNIKCKNCEANYIGKCKRILSYRISEHKKSSESSCCQHESSTGHTMDYDNIEIIDKAGTDMKLRIKELLHILKRKPSLNKQLNSQSNYEIKTLIIQAYRQHRKSSV